MDRTGGTGRSIKRANERKKRETYRLNKRKTYGQQRCSTPRRPERQTDSRTNKQTDGQTDGQIIRKKKTGTDRQTDRVENG